MITSIAIGREFVYSLDSGFISRKKLGTDLSVGPVAPPAGIVTTQLMTTNEWLYVLTDNGTVHRQYRGSASWDLYEVPAGVTHLSSSDETVHVIAYGQIYRRDVLGRAFEPVEQPAALADPVQLDSDEYYLFALRANGELWYRKHLIGGWLLYPEPLSNVVQVASGLHFTYALDSSGAVWRTKTIGRSGWEMLATPQLVSVIAIPSTHVDRLWIAVGDQVAVRLPHEWGRVIPTDNAWVDADWVNEDWVEVA